MTIRVLIIEDSRTMQAILMARLSEESDISVVAVAADAAEGRRHIKQFNPDVVTLDIEMPGMSGLDFLEKIMVLRPTPVIIISGSSQEGSEVTARALALGAVDCYAKSDRSGGFPLDDNGRLADLIRHAAQVEFTGRSDAASPIAHEIEPSAHSTSALIAIGSSTGGIEALQTLLSKFSADCPPTVIVQHVNARFALAIASTLDSVSAATVQLGESGIPLKHGHVYLAPGGDKHLTVAGSETLHLQLRSGEPVSGHMPSVDVLFNSVANQAGSNAVGILLTGMGRDGANGLLAMAQAGAHTIAQDEVTSTVFGMPRAAIELGAAASVLPIEQIALHALGRTAIRHAA